MLEIKQNITAFSYNRELPQTNLGKLAEEVLIYWFSKQDPYSEKYRPYSSLWFRGGEEVDSYIREKFENLVDSAAKGELSELKETAHGMLTLIVLLDQFPRNMYRGTKNMFKYDDIALDLAKEAVAKGMDKKLAPVEKLFLYYPFEHSEKIVDVKQSVNLISKLIDNSSEDLTNWFYRMTKVAKQHLEILEKFQRYPYRNEVIGRDSTEEEIVFLNERSYGFMKSVKKASKKALVQMKQPKLKILVLHSFRQNSNIMRKRTRKMRRELEEIAELVYPNAPIPYMPKGEVKEAVLRAFGEVPNSEHQRCWWNAGGDNEIYEGVELSLSYIQHLNREHGPFDGVLGFSQGGAFVGLLAALKTIKLRFVICVSGFPPRAQKYCNLFTVDYIKTPSLHIVGANDILVDPERTAKLAECFHKANIVTHNGGHFVPDLWPIDKIKSFLDPFCKKPKYKDFKSLSAIEKIEALRSNPDIYREIVGPKSMKKIEKYLFPSNVKDRHIDKVFSLLRDDEKDILVWFLHFKRPQNEVWLRVILVLTKWSKSFDILQYIPKIAGWKYLKELILLDNENLVREKIIDMFAQQLTEDFNLLEQLLTHENITEFQWLSTCAQDAPRIGSAFNRNTRLATDIARKINPLQTPSKERLEDGKDPWAYTKQIASRRYTTMIAKICKALRASSLKFENEHQGSRFINDASLLDKDFPISAAVTSPVPEPVLPAALENLEPLFEFLHTKEQASKPMAFSLGTLMPDGRLDLCKQVVGPNGIQPLLHSMKDNPFATKLLLGNNIIGNNGGHAIADHILSGASKLDVWYIAGNKLGPEGIAPICKALSNDVQVKQLWLKRNPIKPEGAKHLRELLIKNSTIEVLDLVNCGLLDGGLEYILEGLSQNSTLRYIYFCANGITNKGVSSLAKYLRKHNHLKGLFFTCNRIGKTGSTILAEGLRQNTSLERLSLASCRLGDGIQAICQSVTNHPSLQFLDLGYMRNTNAVGEIGNFIGDEGAQHVAKLLENNKVLRSLDLLHNNITQKGLNFIREAMRKNKSLIELRFTQFGTPHNEYAKEEIKDRLHENTKKVNNLEKLQDEILVPTYLKDVLSVYRTK